jgi:hypothetical protein
MPTNSNATTDIVGDLLGGDPLGGLLGGNPLGGLLGDNPLDGLLGGLLGDNPLEGLLSGVIGGNPLGDLLGGIGGSSGGGGDPIGSLLPGALNGLDGGLISIAQDPNDGHVESITLDAVLAGLRADYANEDSGDITPPVQADSTLLGDIKLIEGLGGRNVEGISLFAPLGVGAQATYEDNAGGSTNTSGSVGGETAQATLLENFGNRGLDSVEVTGPAPADVSWGAETGSSNSSSANVGGDTANAGLFNGGGGGGIDSASAGPLHVLFGDSAESQQFPVNVGEEDNTHASLLHNFGDRGVDSVDVDGVGTVFGGEADGVHTDPVVGSIGDSGGLLDGLHL